jgi:cytochrome P450
MEQAVIHEGLRMVSPAVMGFPKKVPAGGDTLCGKFVPEGTDIFTNHCTMLRNKDVFGQDAGIFRPERFLECDADKRSKLIKIVDLAFGHGRWQCPGKTLAWLELNKIFVEVSLLWPHYCRVLADISTKILRTFDLQIANPQAPWRCRGYSSFLIDDFLVSLSIKD